MRRVCLFILSTVLTASQVLAGCGSCAPVHCVAVDAGVERVRSEASATSAAPSSHCDQAAQKTTASQSGVPVEGEESGNRSSAMDCGPDALSVRTSCVELRQPQGEVSTLLEGAGPAVAPLVGQTHTAAIDPDPPDRDATAAPPTRSPKRLFELHAAYLI